MSRQHYYFTSVDKEKGIFPGNPFFLRGVMSVSLLLYTGSLPQADVRT